MPTNDQRFQEWFKKRTPEDAKLQQLAFAYEDRYFKDATLQLRTIKERLAKYEMEIGDDEFQTAYVDLDDVSLDDWIFKAHGFRSNFLGLCQSRKKTIKIARGLTGKELKTTLLHEMIHAYEDLLAMKYREWLLVFWYEKLKQKLGKRQLDRYIDMSTHDVLHAKWHGVFFLLKSLELDLRLRWEHGTVFSYGRVEQFT